MKKELVVDAKDITKMLAEKYGVAEKDIIKSQYSYTIILPEEEKSDADKRQSD